MHIMKTKIKQEAIKYFTSHYPLASQKEIDKQVEDWENKSRSAESLLKFFEERVGFVRGKKVMDVGFGSGGISMAFAKAGAIVSGVDVDPELKDIAERLFLAENIQADFKIYDGRSFPYPDNFFNYVVYSSVLEHVSFPLDVLKEILRVLKPRGRVFISLPNKYYPKETHTLAYFVSYMPRGWANLYLRLLKRSPLEDDNLHFYSYFDIVKMLNKTGYKYEILYKELGKGLGVKKTLILILKWLNIHYTAFLKQLIFIIEKS